MFVEMMTYRHGKEAMNPRERYLSTLLFKPADRIPLLPGRGRKATRDNWYRQGLPADIKPDDINEFAYRQAGGTLAWPKEGPQLEINERMIPQFEEKIIEDKGSSHVVQDWKGNICEISSEFPPEFLRNPVDFVTRRWLKCPVESRADWDEMKRRYDALDPSRLPADAGEIGASLKARTHIVKFELSGPFWQLREWLGFENLCMMLHDDPAFIRDMLIFWEDYVARLLERSLQYVVPDMVHISEDMAYKCFSMVSPAMTREFLVPSWKRWGDIARKAGVPLYAIDSDGFVGELIPIWIEAGFNACDPMEVAAGNDLVALRREFGKKMAYRGGIDKRAMAKGGSAIEKEIERLMPVIESGGYIPGCDHGVPADVSWPDFVQYVKLLAHATGWL
jgi:uroporphyrinogen decarboxylase